MGVAQPVRHFIGSKSARARLVARVGVPCGREMESALRGRGARR